MKTIRLALLLTLLSTQCSALEEYLLCPTGKFKYTSFNYGRPYLSGASFSSFKIYLLKGESFLYFGEVEKPFWHLTRSYEYKIADQLVSSHYSPFFSYGTVMDCLKEYWVYDKHNKAIGYIQGNWETDGAAEFTFSDIDNVVFAKGKINETYSKLSITDLHDQQWVNCTKIYKVMANLTLTSYLPSFSPEITEYYWKIKDEGTSIFSPEFLLPFVAFISEVWWEKRSGS